MKFIHIRSYVPTNTRSTLHGGTKSHATNAKGGLTIAYKREDNNFITYSFGVCSEKDAYCKRSGRDAAIKNFLEGKKLQIQVSNEEKEIPSVILGSLESYLDYQIDLDALPVSDIKFMKKALKLL